MEDKYIAGLDGTVGSDPSPPANLICWEKRNKAGVTTSLVA